MRTHVVLNSLVDSLDTIINCVEINMLSTTKKKYVAAT